MDKQKIRIGAYVISDWRYPDYEDNVLEQLDGIDKVIDMYDDVEITEVFSDKDTRLPLVDRPGFRSLLLQAAEGRVRYVAVDDLCRLTTNMVELIFVLKDIFPMYNLGLIFHRGNIVCTDFPRDLDLLVGALEAKDTEREEDYAGGY